MLDGKKIALYVTGGIAVYKAADLARSFIKEGAEVKVAMTKSAAQFVSPLTFQILTKNAVMTNTFEETEPEVVNHIHLADWADAAVIAPATANTIAKLANGLADNFVTSALLATTAPIFVVPAMNKNMYEHPATTNNLALLKERGAYIMNPDTGFLAEGYEGKGRFPEKERIVKELTGWLKQEQVSGPLSGKRVTVTAGGTKERIDPVRYITNDSSGKMGYRLAEAARDLGATVRLITASSLPVPDGMESVAVESAQDMYEAVSEAFDSTDVLIMAAAVSDYTPAKSSNQKIKKNTGNLIIEMAQTKDILKEMGQQKTDQFLIGFAAETQNIEEYAQRKLKEKNADMIVANDVSKEDAGFNVDTNEVHLYRKEGETIYLPLADKKEIAEKILQYAVEDMKKEG
ncbi:bifunctional phosphopantothenoylcysteine decarboxylase/phosphopantothenate--cysteine ligase CoaBC [Atopococcus tabaci]|uniref:bifunctional phosphopantothenoylcysteine decarboxylase/phosphopantothenate--cysteine ligase CoaBC n=1 Tax=Atopococcus tabaci TaxID=269774 RepID=UPI00240A646B|nr:bifunctional phosphopantothenoylcysteine decarboxylase/phosphopantothenate--cysteine ligase CoaBC [Atopococcus tabaci]